MSHWQRTMSRSINQDLVRLRSRKKEYDLLATGKTPLLDQSLNEMRMKMHSDDTAMRRQLIKRKAK